MSCPVEEIVSCPKCGHLKKYVCWSSINVTLNPELKIDLLQGKLTKFICDNCGKEINIAYDLLYHDMDSSFMIWLKYPEKVYLDKEIDEMFNFFGENYTYRIVHSFNELVEKIKIFDNGLNDITIELFKLFVSWRENIDILDPFYYDRSEKLFFWGETIVLVYVKENKLIEKRYSVRKQLIKVKEVQEQIINLILKKNEHWVCINRDYILKILEASGLITRIA